MTRTLPHNHGMRGRQFKHGEPTERIAARLPRSLVSKAEKEARRLHVPLTDILVVWADRAINGRWPNPREVDELLLFRDRRIRTLEREHQQEKSRRKEMARRLHAVARYKHRQTRALTPTERSVFAAMERDPDGDTRHQEKSPPAAREVPIQPEEIPAVLRSIQNAEAEAPAARADSSVSQANNQVPNVKT